MPMDKLLILLSITDYYTLYRFPPEWVDRILHGLEESLATGNSWPVDRRRFAASLPAAGGVCSLLDTHRVRVAERLLSGTHGAVGLRRLPRGYAYPTLITTLPSHHGDGSRLPVAGCNFLMSFVSGSDKLF